MDAAIVAAIRRLLLEGLKRAEHRGELPQEMVATAASWAICGAVKQWFSTPDRPPAATLVTQLQSLILPMLNPGVPRAELAVEAPVHSRG
jgi:hypothetical protein